MTVPAVAVEGAEVTFGGVVALGGASLHVDPGETVGLIGPNGAGKTTLINVMTGLRRADAGRVTLLGREVTRLSAHRRARLGLRRMFQSGGLVSDETVLTNLAIAHHATGASDVERRSLELLRRVGAEDAAGTLVRDLPAGVARLVELACVLAGDPAVLLLDEPTAGLALDDTDRLADLVARRHDRPDVAVLVVAHDMRFVMTIADRIVVLSSGRVVADGPPAHVRADEQVRRLYLGASG